MIGLLVSGVHSGVGDADGVGVAPVVSALTLFIAPKESSSEIAKKLLTLKMGVTTDNKKEG